jgi:hypothetical protein
MIIDGDYGFALARPEDDEDLRRLLVNTPMPGNLTVSFAREPNYFLGCSTMGHRCDVLVARHLPSGELAGVMCHGIRPVYINGTATEVGTIGQVRIAEHHRGKGLLRRGLPLFIERSRPDLPNFGVMAADNPRARRAMVEHPPPGFVVRDVARITTLGIILRRPKPLRRGSLDVGHGTEETLDEIVDFLRRESGKRQYYPVYEKDDLLEGRLLRGLALEDIIVIRGSGRIRGTVAVWDQSGYKQSIVRAYGPALQKLRPWHDRAARLWHAEPLPAPGEPLHAVYAAVVCVEDDDQAVTRCLIREAYNAARERGFAYLLVGLTDQDPLLGAARRYAHVPYRSWLQASAWKPGEVGRDLYPDLDGRPAFVEIAAL